VTASPPAYFSIARWRAWAPGCVDLPAWQHWSQAPYVLTDNDQTPDVSFLPPLQRRRLSVLARMFFHVAWPLAGKDEALPVVFVCRHGETTRNLRLLESVGRNERLSPTDFSLSVHSAITGLWSIARGDHSEMSAMAGDYDGLEHGILEALSLLEEGAAAVLLLIAEQKPPELYQPYIEDVPFSYALALRLVSGTQWRIQRRAKADSNTTTIWPHALELVRALCLEQKQLRHYCKGRQWEWSCQKA